MIGTACYDFFSHMEERMKKILVTLILLTPILAPAQEGVAFAKYFLDQTMRVDVFHGGDAQKETLSVDTIPSKDRGPAIRAA